MTAAGDFAEHVGDLFGGLGHVTVRRMFGGLGVYRGTAMFALVADGTVYMKTDEALARAYAEAGSAPFVYEGGKKRIEMSYWRLPESALDDPDEALAWARRSLVPAEAAAVEKSAAKARKAARNA